MFWSRIPTRVSPKEENLIMRKPRRKSFDRISFHLPLGQDELVSHVAAAVQKTVMVNQTGSAIAMPRLEDVDALLQNWFAGMEVGNVVTDLISETVNPSGRLPNTWPKKVEDVLNKFNFPKL